MNKTNKIILWIIAIVIIVALIWLGYSEKQPVEEGGVIKIGGLFALSSFGAEWGNAEKDAVMMVIDEVNEKGGINGKMIELVVEDNQSDLTQTTTAMQKLVNIDDVVAIIGPTWFYQVAVPTSKDLKTLTISPSAGGGNSPELNSPYFFNLYPNEKFQMVPIMEDIKEKGYKKAVIIYSLNDWSQQLKDIFTEEADKIGLEIVKDFATQPDAKDFKTEIAKMKDLDFDIVYNSIAFNPSLGEFIKQSYVLKLDKPIYSTSNTDSNVLLNEYGSYMEGIIYPFPSPIENYEDFVNKFESKFGIKPSNPISANAYDTINLLVMAFENGAENSDEIIDFLKSVKDYQGASNVITFNEFGGIEYKEYYLKTIKQGKFIPYQPE
jgi:branched-chain amino acid transport system substrate-binding protein